MSEDRSHAFFQYQSVTTAGNRPFNIASKTRPRPTANNTKSEIRIAVLAQVSPCPLFPRRDAKDLILLHRNEKERGGGQCSMAARAIVALANDKPSTQQAKRVSLFPFGAPGPLPICALCSVVGAKSNPVYSIKVGLGNSGILPLILGRTMNTVPSVFVGCIRGCIHDLVLQRNSALAQWAGRGKVGHHCSGGWVSGRNHLLIQSPTTNTVGRDCDVLNLTSGSLPWHASRAKDGTINVPSRLRLQ